MHSHSNGRHDDSVAEGSRLPAEISDAELAGLKTSTVAGELAVPAIGWRPDLSDHLAMIRREFVGQSQLASRVAELIVLVRRRIDLPANLRILFSILERETAFLAGALSSRWLVSVLDTYADHGTPEQRLAALPWIVLTNVVKLAETERLLQENPAHSEALAQEALTAQPSPLWDGMTTFSLGRGDMLHNMIRRLIRETACHQVILAIGSELLRRMMNHPTLLRRLRYYQPDIIGSLVGELSPARL